MTKMIQEVLKPECEIPAFERTVHATFFEMHDASGLECGIVHSEHHIADSVALGGGRFGGIFEVVDSPLTTTQTRILALLALGIHINEIAKVTVNSEQTILSHVKSMHKRIGKPTIAACVNEAFTGDKPFFEVTQRGDALPGLTPTQRRLMKMYVEHPSNVETLSAELGVGVSTVTTHTKNIYATLGMSRDKYSSMVAVAHLTKTLEY